MRATVLQATRRRVNMMRRRHRLRAQAGDFLLGGVALAGGAHVRTVELGPSVVAYLRTGRRFESAGLNAALRAMPALRETPRADLEPPLAAFCARSAAGRILGITRTLAGRQLCLHESVGMTAALRRLGFDAQVVIGYPVIEPAGGEEELHAWSQLGDVTVTDRLGSAPLNFVELMRYPGDPNPTAPEPREPDIRANADADADRERAREVVG
jgi:hypothetical protein